MDFSGHYSKLVEELPVSDFDYVITVCDQAHESCPMFAGRAKITHRSFDDPPRLAANATTEDGKLSHYRRVRDEIRDYVLSLPEELCRISI